MPYRIAQRLRFPFAGALLVCITLFLLSGLNPSPFFSCCGDSMGFPFLCLAIVFSLFSLIALVSSSTRRPHDAARSPAASSKPFRRLLGLVFSDDLRGRFFVALIVSSMLVLFGAALLFSLSLSFSLSALALGCLSVLSGLGVQFLEGYDPDS